MSAATFTAVPMPHAPHPFHSPPVPAFQTNVQGLAVPSFLTVASSALGASDSPMPPGSDGSAGAVAVASANSTSSESGSTSQLTTLMPSTIPSPVSSASVVLSSVGPSLTTSEPSHMTASAKPGREAAVVKIVLPVVLVSLLMMLAAVGWWLVKRRKERERADFVAKKARWLDQEYVDGIKAQMMGLDHSKIDLGCPSKEGSGGGIFVGTSRTNTDSTVITVSRAPAPASYRMSVGRFSHPATDHVETAPTDLNDPAFEIASEDGSESSESTIKASRFNNNNLSRAAIAEAIATWTSGESQYAQSEISLPGNTYRSPSSRSNEENYGGDHEGANINRSNSVASRISRRLGRMSK